MSKATDTLQFLAIHNSWRRGDETFGMQDPAELGAVIDDAVNLLRRYDELERENAELQATLTSVYDANQRGIKAWQKAHPDKAMVWPDQAELVEWLLCENAALRADRVDWLLSRFALPQTQQLKNNS